MLRTAGKQAESTLFYGWYIVLMAFVANFMSVGTGFYLMNAFMEPLCEAHDWTRTDISLAPGYATIFGLMAQMVFGTIVNRIGARVLMLFGSMVSGIAFFLLIRSETLWQFYACFIVLFIGNAAYGGIVASTAVNNWFIARRIAYAATTSCIIATVYRAEHLDLDRPEDLEKLNAIGQGRVDVTVGSALDIFGGTLPYRDVVEYCRNS